MKEGKRKNTGVVRSAKDCAYIAVFIALLLGTQLMLSAIKGVELVTVLFVAFAYCFGWKRGILGATGFSLLRQFLFGFFPSVLILYLIYYNLLALVFGLLVKRERKLWLVCLIACVCTVCFFLLDCVITPVWYGYPAEGFRVYFFSSLPVMAVHTVCAGVTTALLFPPLKRGFAFVEKEGNHSP